MRKPLSITAGIIFLLFSTFALFFSGVWILESLEIIAPNLNGFNVFISDIFNNNALYAYIAMAVLAFLGFEFAFGVISCGSNIKRYKKRQWKAIVSLIFIIIDVALLVIMCIKLTGDAYIWLYAMSAGLLAFAFIFILIDLISLRSYIVATDNNAGNTVEREITVDEILKEDKKPAKKEPQKEEKAQESLKNVSALEQRINDIMELGARQEAELKAIDAKKESAKVNERIDVVLARYIKMRDSGAISEAEFEDLKKSLIEKEKKID